MSYQTPITIREALDGIHRHDYVLPAIQREFVWSQERIARLFDSLLQGYPFGAFLFWEIPPEHASAYKYYDFMLHYHERKRPHCEPVPFTPGTRVTAVLDGQQRLTSFNIGLRGSHAVKEPRKWYNNPNAYPEKRLHLNLSAPAEPNDLGMVHDFRFLSDDQASARDEETFWFPVQKVLDWEDEAEAFAYLVDHDLLQGSVPQKDVYSRATRLYRAVMTEGTIPYYIERRDDLDKVLDIFVRVNSGGTPLTHSDLLLSIATAQWDNLDARKEIYDLVDELNEVRNGFDFSKDFVLKAGLMLCGIKSVGFKVTNFSHENMLVLEKHWDRVAAALRLAIHLVADFGLSRQTLSAHSAVLPLSYYLYARGVDDSYRFSAKEAEDRDRIRYWLLRSLLKPGVWGSGLDTLLTALRSILKDHGEGSFPLHEVEAEMARRGKSLRFEEEEIEDLVDVKYGDKRAYSILAMLYPFVDLRNEFHVDHVFPRRHLASRALKKIGVSVEVLDQYTDGANRLANLQLLEGLDNIEKSDRLPAEWLAMKYPDPQARLAYLERHDLGLIPEDIVDFQIFYKARRARMAERLKAVLGGWTETDSGVAEPEIA